MENNEPQRLIDSKNERLNRPLSQRSASFFEGSTTDQSRGRSSSFFSQSSLSDFQKALEFNFVDDEDEDFQKETRPFKPPSFFETDDFEENFQNLNLLYDTLQKVEDGITWSAYGLDFWLQFSGDLKVLKSKREEARPTSLRLFNPYGSVILSEDLALSHLRVKASHVIQEGQNASIENLDIWAFGEEEKAGTFVNAKNSNLDSSHLTLHQGYFQNQGTVSIAENGTIDLFEETSLQNHNLIHFKGNSTLTLEGLFHNQATGSVTAEGSIVFRGAGDLLIEEGNTDKAGIAVNEDLVFQNFRGTVTNKGAVVSCQTLRGTISKLFNHKMIAAKRFDLIVDEFFNRGTLQSGSDDSSSLPSLLKVKKGKNKGLVQGNLTLDIQEEFTNEEGGVLKAPHLFTIEGSGRFVNQDQGKIDSSHTVVRNRAFENHADLDLGEGKITFSGEADEALNGEGATLKAKEIILSQRGTFQNDGSLLAKRLENSSHSFVNDGIVHVDVLKHRGSHFDNQLGAEVEIGVLEEFQGQSFTNEGDVTIKKNKTFDASLTPFTLQTLTNSGKIVFLSQAFLNIQTLLNKGKGLIHGKGNISGTIGKYTGKKESILQSEQVLSLRGQTLLLEGKILASQDLSYTALDSFKILKTGEQMGEMISNARLTVDSWMPIENQGALLGKKGFTSHAELENHGIIKSEGKSATLNKLLKNYKNGFIQIEGLNLFSGAMNQGHIEIGFLYDQGYAADTLENTGEFILNGGILKLTTLQNKGILKTKGGRFQTHLYVQNWNNEGGSAEVDQLTLSALDVLLKGSLRVDRFTPLKTYNSLTNYGKTTFLSGGFESRQTKNTGTLAWGNGTYKLGNFTNAEKSNLILLKGSKTSRNQMVNDGLIESPTGMRLDVSKIDQKLGKLKTRDNLFIKLASHLNAAQFIRDYSLQWDIGNTLKVETESFVNTWPLALSVPFSLKTNAFSNTSKIVSPGLSLETNGFSNGSYGVYGEIKSEGALFIQAQGTIDNTWGKIRSQGKTFIKSTNGDVATGYYLPSSKRKDSFVPFPTCPDGKGMQFTTDESMPFYNSNEAFIVSSGNLRIEGQNVVNDFGWLYSRGSMNLKAVHQIRSLSSQILVGGNLTISGGWYNHTNWLPEGMNHYNVFGGWKGSWDEYFYHKSASSLAQVLGNVYFEVSRVTLDSSHFWVNGDIYDQRAPFQPNPLHLFEMITHKRTFKRTYLHPLVYGNWWSLEYALEVPTIRFGQTLAVGGADTRFIITGNSSGKNMFLSGLSLLATNVQPGGTAPSLSYSKPQVYDLSEMGRQETKQSPLFTHNRDGNVDMLVNDQNPSQDAYHRSQINILGMPFVPKSAQFYLQRDAGDFILMKTLGMFVKNLNIRGDSGGVLVKKLHQNTREVANRNGKNILLQEDLDKATASMIFYELQTVNEKMKLMTKLLISPDDFNRLGNQSAAFVMENDFVTTMRDFDIGQSDARIAGNTLQNTAEGLLLIETLKDRGSFISQEQQANWEVSCQQALRLSKRGNVTLEGGDVIGTGAKVQAQKKVKVKATPSEKGSGNIVFQPLTLSSSTETKGKVTQKIRNVLPEIEAEEADMEGSNISLKAIKVKAPETLLKAVGGRVSLLTGEDIDLTSETVTESDAFWQKVKHKIQEDHTKIPCLFTGKLTVESNETVIESVRGQTLEWIQRLQQKGGNVHHILVDEIHKRHEKTLSEGPTQALTAVIALAAGVATAGWGASLGGAFAGTGGLALTGTANLVVSGMTAAAVSSLSAQAAVALLQAKGDIGKAAEKLASSETLKAVGIAMATAGALEGIAGYFDIPLKLDKLSLGRDATFVDHFKKALLTSTVGMAGNVATGEKLERALETLLRATAVNSVASMMASEIGQAYDDKQLNVASHKLAHAFLGGMSGAVLNHNMQEGALAGAMGAFVAETFADITKPDKPLEKVEDLEREKGSRLTRAEHDAVYEKELKDYGKKLKQTTDWSKIVAATSLLLSKRDVQTGVQTATNSLDNNFLVLAYYGVVAAGIAWTIYDVKHEYEANGAEPALKKLGIDIAIGVATGGVLKVGGKVVYKIGQVSYPSAEAAVMAALDKVPGLKLAFGKLVDKLIAGGEKIAQSRLGQGVSKVEQKLINMEDKISQKVGFGGEKKQVRFDEEVKEDPFNKAPYNPRAMDDLLKKQYGKEAVTSSTLPDLSMPNVKLAGKGLTLEDGTHIPFDLRGYPIFDKYIVYEAKIPTVLHQKDRSTHMRQATRDLRDSIKKGDIDANLFTEEQLMLIEKGKPEIQGYTWHHHQDTGRLQLVPDVLHEKVKHAGGYHLWGKKK